MATLLPTKFFVPPIPTGFVVRPQLFEKINEALTHRLTLISAPAGAGKTALVSAWVQSTRKQGIAFSWLSLDDSDNEVGHFLEYLVGCMEESGTTIDRTPLPANHDEQSIIENILMDIIRGLFSINQELILILDDYQHIYNKEIHTRLEYLLVHAPSCLHLVLLTRSDPPLELARLRVSGQLTEVRMENLRFSVQEAGEFLNKSAGVQLSESDVASLNARTEGWIAGLQMAAISLRGREDASAFVTTFAGSHRFVFDYLLEQVLNRQTSEVREFLLRTSILEQLTASLCDAVAETSGAGRRLLDRIERDNLFLVPLDDERGWFRYHHLFADLLRLMLDQTHPGLSIELNRRASCWYEAQGMLLEALQHAISSGDMQLVAQIISANVLVLVENDEVRSTLKKIDAVPLEKLTVQPWLGIARAWALGSSQVNKSHQILDAIDISLENAPDNIESRQLIGHIAAARAFVFSMQGDISNTIKFARQANEQLAADEIAVRAMNLASWGDVLSADKHDPSAMPILEQALELALQAKKPHVAMIASAALASAHLGAGRLHEVHRVCLEALAIAEEYQRRCQRPLSATANVYPLLARVLAEWGENEKAILYARKGLMLSERWGLVDTDVISLNYLGRALVFSNDWEQARHVFQRAEHAAQKISPWFWQMTQIFILDSQLDCETPDVREIAQQMRQIEENGARYPLVLKARLYLRNNQPGEAIASLEQAESELHGQPSLDIVRIYGLRAGAYQVKGDEKQALIWLRKALALAEPENRVATFVREGAAMENLLRLAQKKSISPKFTQRLLAAFESRHKHIPVPVPIREVLIEPLSERELDVLQYLNGPHSTPEIANLLIVSTNTVRTHIKSIYGKLGVHGRSGAVKQAKEFGLLA